MLLAEDSSSISMSYPFIPAHRNGRVLPSSRRVLIGPLFARGFLSLQTTGDAQKVC